MNKRITLKECPRPQLVRDSYIPLDGKWDFRFDVLEDIWPGKNGYQFGFEKQFDILVPFAYQSSASLVNIQKHYNSVWYQKHVELSLTNKTRYILHFEGADYCLRLFVNGKYVGSDTGAYHRMSFDISDYLIDGDNLIVINCYDLYNIAQPRGKQYWHEGRFECWYIDTTGIYKSVWLELVNETYIKNVRFDGDIKNNKVNCVVELEGCLSYLTMSTNVYFDSELVGGKDIKISGSIMEFSIPLASPLHLWDIGEGNLYDVVIELKENDKCIDKIKSYFGLRDLVIKDGKVYLNNKELYQRLVLDQGYWPETHLTPPSNEALFDDIEKALELGFNGVRKHQKVEDDRFYYYADVMGLLVWCEMPSMYDCNPSSRLIFEREWMLEVKQHINHPSIIIWTPFNESWGVRYLKSNKEEQEFVNHIYTMTKKYDPTRFVITNDGWEHTLSDILTFHHYEQDGNKLHSYFDSLDKFMLPHIENHERGLFADGYHYRGQPIMITEFGGTAYVAKTKNESWGYGSGVLNQKDFLSRFSALVEGITSIPFVVGYCYTQLSDVQQEVNGLLSDSRKSKINTQIIKDILCKEDKR